MQKIVLFILISAFCAFSLKAQNVLTIEINRLENSKGKILLELRDGENNYIKGITKEVKQNKCIIRIKNLEAGNYSFRYFHDENNNKELDTNWLGIPNEGFGFSNNASGLFGPPDFEETIIKLKQNTTKKCSPKYYNL
jgi:uncharacterized protein (DUF2141 family)